VPRFEPFRGIRFDPDAHWLQDVTAPPYDVIDAEQRAELAARSPYNIVAIDVPTCEQDYARSATLMASWLAEGALIRDAEPSFYAYRMGFKDEAGRAHQTSGIIGALELIEPGKGDVLPHEQTTPKAKSDRLQLLRSTDANLSPVWGLSMAQGVSGFAELPGTPVARWTDDDGVHHRLYRIFEPGVVRAIREAVAAAPVVIADGHHRYETSLRYRQEWRAAHGDIDSAHDETLAFVVELAEDQLFVQPIHRLLSQMPAGFDLLGALTAWFEPYAAGPLTPSISMRMADAGALALIQSDSEVMLLKPRAERFTEIADLDSARIATALVGVDHEIAYQHGVDNVQRAIERGEAQAGVLLRPVPVSTIMSTARAGGLMPPKSTFFAPKPRTGVVLRALDD
jgi:uncharacterized protein (DUF1015 family)